MTIVRRSRTLHRAVPYKFHFELEVTDWLAFVLLLLLLCLLVTVVWVSDLVFGCPAFPAVSTPYDKFRKIY